MKIKKNQLRIAPMPLSQFEEPIRNVLWPFEHFIFKMKINIYLAFRVERNLQISVDWNLYELILFNIIQNSVKYNQQLDGDICILISCKTKKRASIPEDETYDVTK